MRIAVIAALAALAGCGYVGDPLPPALHIPQPVTELSATQLGPNIVVRFTLPTQTTDDLPVSKLQSVELTANDMTFQVPADASEFPIAAAPFAGHEVLIRMRSAGSTGRQSEWSQLLRINAGEPLRTPGLSPIRNEAEGVVLSWSGNAPMYRISRAIGDAELSPLAETAEPRYVDNTTVYGTRYRYQVTGINGQAQQSLPSETLEITPVDTFAPAVPSGLAAVPGATSIELSWTRSTEDDFASYRIRRATGDGPFAVIATTPTPAYSDGAVQAGQRYRYNISAVDERGNESAPSAPIEAALP